jgi:hypothetical protein
MLPIVRSAYVLRARLNGANGSGLPYHGLSLGDRDKGADVDLNPIVLLHFPSRGSV